MMPSHSMDLPVPRGISILMLGVKFKSQGRNTEMQLHPVCSSKYVSMARFCFSPDGKSSFYNAL